MTCAIGSSQVEFEERMMCTLETKLKGVMAQVKQQAQELWDEIHNLCEDLNKELQVTRQKIKVMQLYSVSQGISVSVVSGYRLEDRLIVWNT
jgi:hypothetical protein